MGIFEITKFIELLVFEFEPFADPLLSLGGF